MPGKNGFTKFEIFLNEDEKWLSAKDALAGVRIRLLFFEKTIIPDIFRLQIRNCRYIFQNHEEGEYGKLSCTSTHHS